MEFQVKREHLVEALASLQNVKTIEHVVDLDTKSGKRTIKRVETRFLLEDGTLTLSATADGVALSCTVEAPLSEEKSLDIVVDTGPLLKALKPGKKPTGEVWFHADDIPDALNCRFGATKLALKALLAIPEVAIPQETANGLEIQASTLATLLDVVAFALPTKKEPGRWYLEGVHLHAQDGKLVAVAMDGNRCARYAVACPDSFYMEEGVTIPSHTVAVILKALDSHPGTVWFRAMDGKLVLRVGSLSLVSVLVDGVYPDYQRLIADDAEFVEIDYRQLKNAIELCVPQSGGAVTVRSVEGETGLAVGSRDYDKGDARTFMEFSDTLASPVAFNPKFMLPALTRETVMAFGDGVKPIQVRGQLDTEFQYVLMPMRAPLNV